MSEPSPDLMGDCLHLNENVYETFRCKVDSSLVQDLRSVSALVAGAYVLGRCTVRDVDKLLIEVILRFRRAVSLSVWRHGRDFYILVCGRDRSREC